MPRRKKGYRKNFKSPPKGCKPYKGKEPWPRRKHTKEAEADPQLGSSSCEGANCPTLTSANAVTLEEATPSVQLDLPLTPAFTRKLNAIRVLSLFDGISCGLVALNKLNLDVEAYFSSEINQDAIAVQRFHFFEQLTPIGCVKSLTAAKLDSLGHIDLILAGSPCEDLSLVNPLRRGLHGEGSTGALFFEFVRIRDFFQLRAREKGTSLFWLYENTTALERQTLAEMTSALGCKPVRRCASEYVAMRRERYFWGNCPLMDVLKTRHSSLPVHLQTVLKPYRVANTACLRTVTSSGNSQRIGSSGKLPVVEFGKETLLYISELELLFGLDEHYTDVAFMSMCRRRRLIAKAWCVPTIVDLLKSLVPLFKSV